MNAPTETVPMTSRAITTAALLLLMAMSAMEATVVATAMPTVIAELGGVSHYGWVSAAYFLAVTVATPVYGKLADARGRKPVALAGVALFLIGSFVSGLAPNIAVLIAARAVQGLGAGGLQPVTLTIVGDLYTLEERGKVQGFFSGIWAASSIAGPLLGGWIVHALSWRWVFWVNVPIGLVGALVLVRAYHEARAPEGRPGLDVAGAAWLSLGTLALLLGVNGTLTVPMLVASVVGLWAFVRAETTARDPMLPIALLRERVIAVTSVSGFILGAAMMASLMLVPLYAQGVLQRSPTEAGTSVAPMLLGWPIAAMATSRILSRVGPRPPVLVGSALIAAALGALALTIDARTRVGTIQAWMFVYGVGMGLAATATLLAVQTSQPWSRRGVATATNLFARSIGGAIGTGALGALLARRLEGRVPVDIVRALLDVHTRHGQSARALRRAARGLADAMHPIFWALAILALANLAVVTLVPRELKRAEE